MSTVKKPTQLIKLYYCPCFYLIFSKLVENWDEINEMEVFLFCEKKIRTDYNHLKQLNWLGTNEWKFGGIEMWAIDAKDAHCWLRHLIRVSLYQIQWRKIWLIDVIIWPVENTIFDVLDMWTMTMKTIIDDVIRYLPEKPVEVPTNYNFYAIFLCMPLMRVCVCKTFIIIFASRLLCSNWIGESE